MIISGHLEETRRSIVNLFVDKKTQAVLLGILFFSLMVDNKKQPVLKAHTFGGLL